jgi:large subunit ribosomal protein L21
MYAVIRAGGKQHKVAKGDVISIEKVKGDSDSVEFVPLLIVDDKGKARTSHKELADARVVGKVIGDEKGPKVEVYKYRNKTGYRRHTGHRQKYTSLQISDIKLTAGRSKKADDGDSKDAAKSDTKSEQE